jgi:hypothetical protein
MRWATLSHVHLDRVAAPWLVLRFVDPDAQFTFIGWGADGLLPDPARLAIPEGAIPLGVPGVKLGLHDADGSCFAKVLRTYELQDLALWSMERIIAAGISNALGTPRRPDETERERALGTALDLIGSGLSVNLDDAEHIAQALPLYDALYTVCRIEQLPTDARAAVPRLPPQSTPFLRSLLAAGAPAAPTGARSQDSC